LKKSYLQRSGAMLHVTENTVKQWKRQIKKAHARDAYTRSLMFAFGDPQFGVAFKELFHRLHLGATSMYRTSLDEYLQRWHRSRRVYSNPKKRQEPPKPKVLILTNTQTPTTVMMPIRHLKIKSKI
jgi:hypothetical protein